MPTNPYFYANKYSGEAKLFHDLVREIVQIHGIDVFYVKRTADNIDAIFQEDTTASFKDAYKIEMYLKSADGFEGEGDFLSKFGVEIRDRVSFIVARKTFAKHVTRYDKDVIRPREGDLIFFPLNKKLFEIRFVEHESMFYPVGDLYTFELQCELFEYSNEPIDTGVPQIDVIEDKFSTVVNIPSVLLPDGNIVAANGQPIPSNTAITKDKAADNAAIQQAANAIIDWSDKDPFSEGGTY